MTESDDPQFGVRRDAELDRGRFLEFVSGLNIVVAAASFLIPFFLLASVPLTVAVWIAAHRDLKKIRNGRMDHAGEALTAEARWRCIATAILNALAALFWGLSLFLIMRDEQGWP